MKAEVEVYKGIEFVRLSSLPPEQSQAIRQSSFSKRIIKILRGSELLSDCLPYNSYTEWYHDHQIVPVAHPITPKYKISKSVFPRFAFK